MAVRTNPNSLSNVSRNITKAAQEVNLAEISQLATLFQETSKSQKNLLDALVEEHKDTNETLKATLQLLNDLLQVLTGQSELAEKQSQRLVAVTLALTKATTALRALPPGSAVRSPIASNEPLNNG